MHTMTGHACIALILVALIAGVVAARAFPGLPPSIGLEPEPSSGSDDRTDPKPSEKPKENEADDDRADTKRTEADDRIVLFPELRDDELRTRLKAFSEAGHDVLSYRRAREVMYWIADNDDGVITTIYARRPTALEPGEWPDQQVLNCEHLWPQSKGAKKPPMRTDLFHLRPAVPRINSTRSNHPFGTPVAEARPGAGWRVGRNEDGRTVFEPPPSVRGDVSRSIFYYSVRYEAPIHDDEEAVLRTWAAADPVDDTERARAAVIEEYQGNSNPFIIDETIVQRISDF